MMKDSQNTPRLAQTALFGGEPIAVQQKEKKPETPPQPPKLAIVYGVCCRCKERPATLKSPSGNPEYIYCEQCGRSRCGVHTIADFEMEGSSGLWLDPCCIKRDLKQQNLIEEKSEEY